MGDKETAPKMYTILLTQQTNKAIGANWVVAIARGTIKKNELNLGGIGELGFFDDKDDAWKSIEPKVAKLDFVNNQILFNGVEVNSFDEVLIKLAEL